jgi:hypothetical protein
MPKTQVQGFQTPLQNWGFNELTRKELAVLLQGYLTNS